MTEHEHPVAAPATPIARSALAVVRCSGEGCISLVGSLFESETPLTRAESHTIHHGVFRNAAGEVVDDVMVSVMRSPNSYTGEDSAEIYGHGSPAGIRRILEALYEAGFHPAGPGEFTRRAFLNGKLDLTRAEAINDLVSAQTLRAHRLALERLAGSVEDAIESIRSDLILLMAGIAAQLDYPEEDSGDARLDRELLSSVTDRTRKLAITFQHGVLVQEGVSVVITGPTNAGKSSLFNMMLRQDRSIVSDVAGTTRDYVEATVDIGGVPVRLFDTAGQTPTGHDTSAVESEGIRRSRAVAAAADLALYVVDGAEGFTSEDEREIAEMKTTTPVVVVWNKIDLELEGSPAGAVSVSALTGLGLEELNHRVVSEVSWSIGDSSGDSVVIDSARQHQLLRRAVSSLELAETSATDGFPADAIAVDLQDALDAVGEITGAVSSDEVLDAVFRSFCLGK